MAEVIRFAAADRPRSPRYELLPHLRSHKPNWEVYRRCGVPVLRPQPGHIFLAGRVRDLRLRSFVAVGLRHGYFTRTTSRLAGHFLDTGHFPDEKEPFTQIAAELYVADALRRADVNHPPVTGSSDRPAESEYEGHFRADALRRAAEEQFDVLLSDRPLEAGVWVRRARGLLDAAILGLPESSLGVFLECEHREPTLDTLGATRALNLLASEIVSELRAYLEDRSTDIIWARLGRSAQDEMYKRFSSSHPETFPARVRNTLTHVGVEGLNLGHDTHTPAGESGRESAEDGPGLFLVRGRTLGGRFTAVCSQPVVRQQEVLLSADEVMLEVAHALCAGGYRLLAVAGEEFLVEVAERDHEAAARVVNEIGTAVAAQLLGELAVVSVEARERW